MATANPVMNEAVYRRAGYESAPGAAMTVQGAVVKTAFFLVLLVIAASYTWSLLLGPQPNEQLAYGLAAGGAIVGFIIALITCFVPKAAPVTGSIYAICEGLFLGAISAAVNTRYPGIAVNAVMLTIGVFAMMLFLYGTRIIQVTQSFVIGVVAATGAIFLVYLVSMVMNMFGVGMPYIHGSGPIGIGFSVIVVIIAALNLILDFGFIEQGARSHAPKYMEWYGAFSLLVTLVWMYIEILRLLAKIQANRN